MSNMSYSMTREQAQAQVELKNSLQRLMRNRDFKKLILDDFMKDTAVRMVKLKADPNMREEHQQKAVNATIDAIGELDQYLRGIEIMGNHSAKLLADAEAELSEEDTEEEDAE